MIVARALKGTMIAVAMLAASLTACDNSSSPSEVFARSQQYIDQKNYRAAIVDLKSLLQERPNDSKARWLLATVYLDVEDWQSAQKELEVARRLGVGDDAVVPLLARALLLQGDIDGALAIDSKQPLSELSRGELSATSGLAQLAKGNSKQARVSIDSALKLAPWSPWVQLAQAQFLTAQQQPAEAKEILKSIPEVNSLGALAWQLLGDIHYQQAEYAEAEAAYTKAVGNRFFVGVERIRRGMARLAQNNLTGAAEDAEVVAKHALHVSGAGYFVGLVRFREQRYAEAIEVLERLDGQGRGLLAKFLLASAHLRVGNQERAIDLASAVVAAAPQFVPARRLLAWLHWKQGRPVEAEGLLRPIVTWHPDDLSSMNLLAAILVAQGEVAQAAPLFKRMIAAKEVEPATQARAGVGLVAAGQTEEGLAALKRAVRLAPGTPDNETAMVTGLIEADRPDEALESAMRFVDQHEGMAAAWGLLADAHQVAGQPEQARDAFLKALSLQPGYPAATLGIASLERRAGNNAEARDILQQALRQHPDDTRLLYALAEIEVAAAHLDAANSLLQRAVRAAPEQVAPRLMLARLLTLQGNTREAMKLLADAPGELTTGLLEARAVAALKAREFNQARQALEELRRRDPGNPQSHFALIRVYFELGERSELAATVERVLELVPGEPRASMAKATLLASEGRVTEAGRLLDALEVADDDPALLTTRLFLARVQGDSSASLGLARQLFAARPDSDSLQGLAVLLVRNGELDEADIRLRAWIRQHTQDVAALSALAELSAHNGRTDEAISLLQRVVRIDPANVTALNNLAWHLRETDPAQALTIAERAARLAPGSPALLDTYAEILALNGKRDEALSTINQAVVTGGGVDIRMRRNIVSRSMPCFCNGGRLDDASVGQGSTGAAARPALKRPGPRL